MAHGRVDVSGFFLHYVSVTEEQAWKRLGSLIIDRRVALGMKTSKSLAEAAGVTPRLIGDLENGRRSSYAAATKAAIEQALQWQAGTVESILAGGQPTEPASPNPLSSDPTVMEAIDRARNRIDDSQDDSRISYLMDAHAHLLDGAARAWSLVPVAADLGATAAKLEEFTRSTLDLILETGTFGVWQDGPNYLRDAIAEYGKAEAACAEVRAREQSRSTPTGADRPNLKER